MHIALVYSQHHQREICLAAAAEGTFVSYPTVNDGTCARSSTRRWRSTIGRLTSGPAHRRGVCVAQTVYPAAGCLPELPKAQW